MGSTKGAYPFAEKQEKYASYTLDQLRYAAKDAAAAARAMKGHDSAAENWYMDDYYTITDELRRRESVKQNGPALEKHDKEFIKDYVIHLTSSTATPGEIAVVVREEYRRVKRPVPYGAIKYAQKLHFLRTPMGRAASVMGYKSNPVRTARIVSYKPYTMTVEVTTNRGTFQMSFSPVFTTDVPDIQRAFQRDPKAALKRLIAGAESVKTKGNPATREAALRKGYGAWEFENVRYGRRLRRALKKRGVPTIAYWGVSDHGLRTFGIAYAPKHEAAVSQIIMTTGSGAEIETRGELAKAHAKLRRWRIHGKRTTYRPGEYAYETKARARQRRLAEAAHRRRSGMCVKHGISTERGFCPRCESEMNPRRNRKNPWYVVDDMGNAASTWKSRREYAEHDLARMTVFEHPGTKEIKPGKLVRGPSGLPYYAKSNPPLAAAWDHMTRGQKRAALRIIGVDPEDTHIWEGDSWTALEPPMKTKLQKVWQENRR